MGGHKNYSPQTVKLRKSQSKRLDTSNETRIVIGGYERITYEEIVNGTKVIRTRWRKKRTREKRKRT